MSVPPVPGPLPVLGAGAAFGGTHRLFFENSAMLAAAPTPAPGAGFAPPAPTLPSDAPMAPPSRDLESRSDAAWLLPSQIGFAGMALLILYVLLVLSALLPTRLLDPAWQLSVASVMINNGFLALLALALVHLAAYLDPARPSLVRRRDDFASWALIAVLGFGLLIPLQGYAVWRGLTTANAAQQDRLGAISGRLTALRQAISTAPTIEELQRRLAALKAPPLDAEDLAQPLPQLRRSMLASLERTQNQARDRLGGIPATGVWQLAQASLRSALSSLVLLLGFAAFTRRQGMNQTLLQQWKAWFFTRRKRSAGQARFGRTRVSLKEDSQVYVRNLMGEDTERSDKSDKTGA